MVKRKRSYRRRPRRRVRRTYRRRRFRLSRRMRISSQLTPWKSTCQIPVNTQGGSPKLYPGKFFLGINFNGSPYQNTTDKSIILHSQDSLLTPLVGLALPGSTQFYGLYAQCRCAAVKLKYIPHHQNDGSSIVLWRPMYITYDYDGHEGTLVGASVNNLMTHGSFRTKNLERPWKYYKKSLKYRKFSKIPCPEIGDPTTSQQNIAGMWHGVGDAIASTENAYGTHIQMFMEDATQGFLHGTIFCTVYMVYKDRLS